MKDVCVRTDVRVRVRVRVCVYTQLTGRDKGAC